MWKVEFRRPEIEKKTQTNKEQFKKSQKLVPDIRGCPDVLDKTPDAVWRAYFDLLEK